jgi:hypothetical protein
MMARMDSQLEKMEPTVDVFKERLKKMEATDLEANPEYNLRRCMRRSLKKGPQ